MSTEKMNVVLINGSPKLKAKDSVSEQLIRMQESAIFTNAMFESTENAAQDKLVSSSEQQNEVLEIHKIFVRDSLHRNNTVEDFEAMLNADSIIITFPLYIFCVPGILMRYLQDFHQYWMQKKGFRKKVKVYTVVNCGFPESYINEEAVGVIKSFCRQTGAEFGFGIMVGGGGMLLGTADAPIMRKLKGELMQAFLQIQSEILGQSSIKQQKNIMLAVKFPRRMYHFMANRGWYSGGRQNGLKNKDLFRKPYLASGK